MTEKMTFEEMLQEICILATIANQTSPRRIVLGIYTETGAETVKVLIGLERNLKSLPEWLRPVWKRKATGLIDFQSGIIVKCFRTANETRGVTFDQLWVPEIMSDLAETKLFFITSHLKEEDIKVYV